MPKILTTKAAIAVLEDVIKKAKKDLYLISYNFILSDSFMTTIRQAVNRDVLVHLVYGVSLKESTYEELKKLPNIKIYKLDKLHAKVFANETKCIVGSMNFSEVSELNNHELAVMLSAQNDREAYDEVVSWCKDIIGIANLERPSMPKSVMDQNRNANYFKEDRRPKPEVQGYCIRTRKRIPLDHDMPYSTEAFREWTREGKDVDQEERYDHFTGELSYGGTSRAKPVLSKNWQDYLEHRPFLVLPPMKGKSGGKSR